MVGIDAPGWIKAVDRINHFLTQDLFGGPKLIKMVWSINLHKILTPCLTKHISFPDPRWEAKVTIGYAVPDGAVQIICRF